MCIALNSTAIKCKWSPPDLNDYFVLGYEIVYKLADGFDYYLNYGDIISSRNLTSEENELIISSLNPYTGYVLALSASTVPTPINGDTASGLGSLHSEPDSDLPLEVNMTISQTSAAVITLAEGKPPTKGCRI